MTSTFHRLKTTGCRWAVCWLLLGIAAPVHGQNFGNNSAVGGVAIDPDGVLSAPTAEDERNWEQIRRTAMAEVPADLEAFSELRAVSLKQLEETIAQHRAAGTPLPEAVVYLAGLQRVQYVLVYPERGDIVLAGPAEGWRIDALGNVVGTTTGRPVLLLDDLMVALRSRQSSRLEPLSCSIDPTPEGLQRLQAVASHMRTIGNPRETARRFEEAMGPQVVSVSGVPATSHFARVMVAADFRMKRLAMNMQTAPIAGMPSYLQMMKAGSRGMHSMTPRWWLAPKYDPIATDADGLTWELRGQGVQCMTEADYVNSQGQIEHSGKSGKVAARWAQTLTERFEELCDHDSAFGQLRNIMDLAVMAALVERQGLIDRTELELPHILAEESLVRFNAPSQVATTASLLKKGKNWVISASGGVQILPWQIAQQTEQTDSLGGVREQLSTSGERWWRE